MTARVTAALKVVEIVAGRDNPKLAMTVGEIARLSGASLSRTSRLCSELEGAGLLEHGTAYGTYGLGASAVELSGRASVPFARAVRYALTLTGHLTGETVCLAARSATGTRVIATVESLWTLHAPALIGEVVEGESSIELALACPRTDEITVVETVVGSRAEIAAPIFDPAGVCVAALAVRLPLNRLDRHGPGSRVAVRTACRTIENAISQCLAAPRVPRQTPSPNASPISSLAAALRILQHLADRQDTVAGTARGAGLRADRTQRLLESCRRSGLVTAEAEGQFRLSWSVQGWHRAAGMPIMTERGKPLVAEVARRTNTCAFLTILKGMRSFTLVEELAVPGEGLRMSPWLGRAHPIVGSDGGPSLVIDFELQQIAELFPPRYTRMELDRFIRRVRQVAQDGCSRWRPLTT